MRYAILLFILCITIQGFAADAPPSQEEFSVDTSISKNDVTLDQQLTLQVTLKYPSGFRPNNESMRRNMLNNGSFKETPFILDKEIEHLATEENGIVTEQFGFYISPQRAGKYSLSTGIVQFDPVSKEGKPHTIASDIYTITVTVPNKKVELESLNEPPMPLSRELLVSLSQANRIAYLANQERINYEAEENADFLRRKAFPWVTIIAAFAVGLVILFVRYLPAPEQIETIDPLLKEKIENEIRIELQKLGADTTDADAGILRLDFLLRRFLLNKYGFPAFSFTSQELDKEIVSPDMAASVKDGMKKVFRQADKIKFAKHRSSSEEFMELLESVKNI